jgi:TatD DNase family protein
MSYWIDTHAHIYADEFKTDRQDMLERAMEAVVTKIFMPNIDHTSVDGMLELEGSYPDQCFALMGLHPCSVKKDFEKELYQVESWLTKRRFFGLGEMGTDLYWDKTFWEQQKEAFVIQVGWAKKYKLPLVIHCRESLGETIEILEPLVDSDLTGVFHCFSGSTEQARRLTDMGFYIGIGGVSTFKNGGMDKVIPELNINTVVLETDSPYLAPVPHRGKRNEPSFIPVIAHKVADLRKTGASDIQTTTTQNAERLFNNLKPLVNINT